MSAPLIPGAALTGVTSEAGECDRCHRELGRVYEVSCPDGSVLALGRRCCTKVTGYSFSALERALAQRIRVTEVDRRLAIIDAEFPDLADVDNAVRCTAAVEDGWWPRGPGDLSGYVRQPYDETWQAYVARCTA